MFDETRRLNKLYLPVLDTGSQGRHCPTLAGMARVETPVIFAHLISFLAIFSCFLPLCHRILPIVSPVFEIFKTPGMAIAIPAILVSPPLVLQGVAPGPPGRGQLVTACSDVYTKCNRSSTDSVIVHSVTISSLRQVWY